MTLALATLAVLQQRQVRQGTPLPNTRRFAAEEAIQGVAVDKDAFYAVNNYAIGKYDKRTGKKLAEWKGSKGGPIIHLDSGLIHNGKLYCAHSNFPGIPMISSIEVWDAKTLKHIESHALGFLPGSATWIDWHDNSWWIAFANYTTGDGAVPGRGNEFSYLARYDKEWRQIAAYTYPKEMVAMWDGMSNSGGFFLPDGTLLLSPHHLPELYIAKLPEYGPVLQMIRTVPVETEGQGVALDPDGKTIWAIQRRTREVLAFELPRR